MSGLGERSERAAGAPGAAAPVASERGYVEWSLASYLEKLASDSPEPGGGSVAALVAALGAALVSMVAHLTLGKAKYADVQEEMAELEQRAGVLREQLEDLVTLDAQAYAAVAVAMKLPQEDAAQKAERKRVLQGALNGAAAVPLLADAAAQAAALNVKINLAWIEDEDFKRDAWSRIEETLSETAHMRDIVLALTYSKL
jgi:formiminotetrahydrofolate cyclodeaminase